MSEKTEKEKMLSGELYYSGGEDLERERIKATKIWEQYNATSSDEIEKRTKILKTLFKNVGEKIYILPPFRCDYGYNISIGNKTFINYGCIILDVNTVEIGDNVLIGPNVQIYSATHPIEPDIRLKELELGLPIKIGNNVWIGGGAIICPGVSIGNNTTIGAGSVVTKDIPANVVAVGNPCRIIKKV